MTNSVKKDTEMRREVPHHRRRLEEPPLKMMARMMTLSKEDLVRGPRLTESSCEGKHLLERNIRSHITNKHKVDENGDEILAGFSLCEPLVFLPLKTMATQAAPSFPPSRIYAEKY